MAKSRSSIRDYLATSNVTIKQCFTDYGTDKYYCQFCKYDFSKISESKACEEKMLLHLPRCSNFLSFINSENTNLRQRLGFEAVLENKQEVFSFSPTANIFLSDTDLVISHKDEPELQFITDNLEKLTLRNVIFSKEVVSLATSPESSSQQASTSRSATPPSSLCLEGPFNAIKRSLGLSPRKSFFKKAKPIDPTSFVAIASAISDGKVPPLSDSKFTLFLLKEKRLICL